MNTLKKEKSLDLQEKLIYTKEQLSNKKSSSIGNNGTPEMIATVEKSISSYVQASLQLPKVNLMILQASVVEDMCSFSALDNVRDITCVSLLCLSIKSTTFQFCKTAQSKKTVEVYIQKQRVVSKKKKKSKIVVSAADLRGRTEPFSFESSETQKEEVLMTGSIQNLHSQLRRLKNDSSIIKDACITAIPRHKSKVFFKYVDVPRLSSFRTSTPVESGVGDRDKEDTRLGFNMGECGFEGISVKFARRSSNQGEKPGPDVDEEEDEDDARQ